MGNPSEAEGFPHGTFQGAKRSRGCGKPSNGMVWDGTRPPGFSMAASRASGCTRTRALAPVPNMPSDRSGVAGRGRVRQKKEPIRSRMGSGISGLSPKVVNRWYGRRSECARGARPCALAGFAPIFSNKNTPLFRYPNKFISNPRSPVTDVNNPTFFKSILLKASLHWLIILVGIYTQM